MKPKQIWANLTVEDLERTTKFYTDLGFKSNRASKELIISRAEEFGQGYDGFVFTDPDGSKFNVFHM